MDIYVEDILNVNGRCEELLSIGGTCNRCEFNARCHMGDSDSETIRKIYESFPELRKEDM